MDCGKDPNAKLIMRRYGVGTRESLVLAKEMTAFRTAAEQARGAYYGFSRVADCSTGIPSSSIYTAKMIGLQQTGQSSTKFCRFPPLASKPT